MKAGLRTLGSAVAWAALLVLGACGGDDREALAPVTSLFNGGSPDSPVTMSPSAGESSTMPGDARQRCVIDARTLRTAQEAFYASNGLYASTSDELVH